MAESIEINKSITIQTILLFVHFSQQKCIRNLIDTIEIMHTTTQVIDNVSAIEQSFGNILCENKWEKKKNRKKREKN